MCQYFASVKHLLRIKFQNELVHSFRLKLSIAAQSRMFTETLCLTKYPFCNGLWGRTESDTIEATQQQQQQQHSLCYFLTELFKLSIISGGSFVLCQVSVIHSFLLLNSIPWHVCIKVCLIIHMLQNIRDVFRLGYYIKATLAICIQVFM